MHIGVLQHLAGDTLASVRNAGWHDTLRIIASTIRDRSFDRTYGTDTAGYENPHTYAPDDPLAERAKFYVPTRARPFLSFLRRNRISAAGTFVDYGCGKGRAMLVAAQYGFRAVTGIEFSPTLCLSAMRNIELFRNHIPQTTFEVICDDAGRYEVRRQDSVFYFYDPFDDDLVEHCLDQIKVSLDFWPREVVVIYHNSLAEGPAPFHKKDFLVETPGPRFEGNAFYLFRNLMPPARRDRC
jgi:SAM-dependent methyltransferase